MNKLKIFWIWVLVYSVLIVCSQFAHAQLFFNDTFEDGDMSDWLLSNTPFPNVTAIDPIIGNFSLNISQSTFSQSYQIQNLSALNHSNVSFYIIINSDGAVSDNTVSVGDDLTFSVNPISIMGVGCSFGGSSTDPNFGIKCGYNLGAQPDVYDIYSNITRFHVYNITYVLDFVVEEWYLYINHTFINFSINVGTIDGGIPFSSLRSASADGNSSPSLDHVIIYNDNPTALYTDNICVYNETYDECGFNQIVNTYIPNITVNFIDPTYLDGTNTQANSTVINVTTSQSALKCNLSFGNVFYNMSNITGTIFTFNITHLNLTTYSYFVNCSTINVSNLTEVRTLTIVPCPNEYYKTVQPCINGVRTKIYADNSSCSTQTNFPSDNGTNEECSIATTFCNDNSTSFFCFFTVLDLIILIIIIALLYFVFYMNEKKYLWILIIVGLLFGLFTVTLIPRLMLANPNNTVIIHIIAIIFYILAIYLFFLGAYYAIFYEDKLK